MMAREVWNVWKYSTGCEPVMVKATTTSDCLNLLHTVANQEFGEGRWDWDYEDSVLNYHPHAPSYNSRLSLRKASQ